MEDGMMLSLEQEEEYLDANLSSALGFVD